MRDLQFDVGDQVYLKMSHMKVVMRFGKKGKLIQTYIGLYESLQRVGNVAYELKLTQDMASVHPMFMFKFIRSV